LPPRLLTRAPPLDPAGGLCSADPLHCLLVFHILATALKQVTYSNASIERESDIYNISLSLSLQTRHERHVRKEI